MDVKFFDFSHIEMYSVFTIDQLVAMWAGDTVTLDTLRRFGVFPTVLVDELKVYLEENKLRAVYGFGTVRFYHLAFKEEYTTTGVVYPSRTSEVLERLKHQLQYNLEEESF